MGSFEQILALGLIVILFFLCIGIVLYVLGALALYKLANNNGYSNISILAWIPIANLYLLGVLSGGANLFNAKWIDGNILGILLAVLPFISGIPVLGFIALIAFIILDAYAMYGLYSRIDESSALVMTIISIILPIVAVIYLFSKRDAVLSQTYIG